MSTNETYFEASNGWQFRVNIFNHAQYRFQGESRWNHLGTQLTLGLIEWAQSEIWTEES